jgi:hypothetical protein
MSTLQNPRFHRALFFFLATAWILVAIFYAAGYGLRTRNPVVFLLCLGMAGFAAWLVFLGFHLGRRSKTAYVLAVLTIVVSLPAGLFDDLGVSDLLFFLFTAFVLLVLILGRKAYWGGTA